MKTFAMPRAMKSSRRFSLRRNVGAPERWASLLGGGLALGQGARTRGWSRAAWTGAGSYLLFRGISGYCPAYHALGRSTARLDDAGLFGSGEVVVRTSLLLEPPPEVVYGYWRDFQNLSRHMRHIQEIRGDGNRSHWVARGPLGTRTEWDAMVTEDIPNERLCWRSEPGSRMETRGEVHFKPTLGGGTQIDVEMRYRPAGRFVPSLLRGWLGGISARLVQRDLYEFKRAIENAQVIEAPYVETASQG